MRGARLIIVVTMSNIYCGIKYCSLAWYTVVCSDILWYTVIHCDILWYTVVWYTVIYCDILWYDILSQAHDVVPQSSWDSSPVLVVGSPVSLGSLLVWLDWQGMGAESSLTFSPWGTTETFGHPKAVVGRSNTTQSNNEMNQLSWT